MPEPQLEAESHRSQCWAWLLLFSQSGGGGGDMSGCSPWSDRFFQPQLTKSSELLLCAQTPFQVTLGSQADSEPLATGALP